MPRTARRDLLTPGAVLHVIARGNNKMTVFLDEEDFRLYESLLREAVASHGAALWHYVLMPNHVHLLLRTGDGLSALMHAVQLPYARHFCRKYQRVGHVWQGRFKSLLVEDDAYLFACGNYIEHNPVRAGLARFPEAWPHSSYRAYAFGESTSLVTFDPFYLGLAKNGVDRQMMYRKLHTQTKAV